MSLLLEYNILFHYLYIVDAQKEFQHLIKRTRTVYNTQMYQKQAFYENNLQMKI